MRGISRARETGCRFDGESEIGLHFLYAQPHRPRAGDERFLNFRLFDRTTKRQVYERQKGICPICAADGREKIQYKFEEMDADHIVPWSRGGKTNIDNCQMLCIEHNRGKGNR